MQTLGENWSLRKFFHLYMLDRPFGVIKIERQCAYAEPPAQPENTYQ